MLRVKINQMFRGRQFRDYQISFSRTVALKKWVIAEENEVGYIGRKPVATDEWITVRKLVPENEIGLWAKLHLGWWDVLEAKNAQP